MNETVYIHTYMDETVYIHTYMDETVYIHTCMDETVYIHTYLDETVYIHTCIHTRTRQSTCASSAAADRSSGCTLASACAPNDLDRSHHCQSDHSKLQGNVRPWEDVKIHTAPPEYIIFVNKVYRPRMLLIYVER